MEQLINANSKIKNASTRAQTTSMSPSEIKEMLVDIETTIKGIRFPRVPNKEDAVNRSMLIEEITIGYVRLEYLYLMFTNSTTKEFSQFAIKRSKEVKKWIG